MHRIALAAVLVAAVAAAVAVGRAGGAAGRTVVAVAHPRGVKTQMANPKRPALGDRVVEQGVLTTTAGKADGTYGLQSTLLSLAGKGSELALAALSLPSGTVTAAGVHAAQDSFTLPVVGGTGAYEGVRGTASFAAGAGGAVRVTLSLEP
jgi:hypothetical protein